MHGFALQQVVNSTYQLDANLALLRLYQFNPEKINPPKLLRLLVKALMQLPSPDFNTCLYLIPDHVQEQEAMASLIVMAGHLQACRFKDFWASVEGQRDLLNSGAHTTQKGAQEKLTDIFVVIWLIIAQFPMRH
jgi:translation initiation factor 3 subunit K